MALLLAMYQKMRLIREKNQVTLDLTKYSSKLDRVTKNIERVQKRYTSLFAQLDQKAKMMQSNATLYFQNMTGLGTNSVNPYNYTGSNQFVYQTMQSILQNGYNYSLGTTDSDNKPEYGTYNFSMEKFATMWAHYQQNGKFVPKTEKGADDKYTEVKIKYSDIGITDDNWKDKECYDYEGFNAMDVQAFTAAMQQAQMQQQQAQMWVQNANQQYGNNVSIWLEAQKAQLEAEQDAALEPLNYQETMWELEKNQAEAKLERIKANLESYNSLLSEESQNTAPKFGLR